ncbi:MAG: hypothetical protein J2P17_24930, partial [Mycobacterium sp.]|nr:hypothetical protein [Mycobacterium sp.]
MEFLLAADVFTATLRTLFLRETRPSMFRRHQPLPKPILWLAVGPPADHTLANRTAEWLAGPRQRAVPRALVKKLDQTPDTLDPERVADPTGDQDPQSCLQILQELHERLSADGFGMGPIAFPRYHVADWLTRQRLNSQGDGARELLKRFPQLLQITHSDAGWIVALANVLVGLLGRGALIVQRLLPFVRVWFWESGRVPGLYRVSRWCMRQPYLAPGLSGRFVGFAVRLTAPSRRHEDETQVAKFLVHAFLADLAEAYNRRWWRLSSWRRTAYPVVVLDGVIRGGHAARLIRWINDIRNETGKFDPLVVIAVEYRAGTRPRPHAFSDQLATGSDDDPLQKWRSDIETRRLSRDSTAWDLRIRLPNVLAKDVPALGCEDRAKPPVPCWLVRRWLPVKLVVLLLVVALMCGVGWWWVLPRHNAQCTVLPWGADTQQTFLPWLSGVQQVEMKGGECLGYSDNDRQVFSDDADLQAIQREAFRLNRQAQDIHRKNPNRPVVSLVY